MKSKSDKVKTKAEWAALHCRPAGKEDAWSQEEIEQQLPLFEGWSVLYEADGKTLKGLRKVWNFGNFEKVAKAVQIIIGLANVQDHHPDVEFSYGNLATTWSTHSAGGLSHNDWICAARLDSLLNHLG